VRRSGPTARPPDRLAPAREQAVIVRDGSRALRRSVRRVVWLVLEELALTAVNVDGITMASTSARAIAADLGLDPAPTASALPVLRDRGLVELTRPTGTAGRFGLSVYRLGPIPGVEVLAPCPTPPCVEGPRMVSSDTDGRSQLGRRSPRPPRSSPSTGDEQGALDLELGTR
jgi:hypothetical protein